LRDEYEPDDSNPQPIAIGETQTHNFYPVDDTDTVRFLAKAERYYRVFTAGLAMGVDTALTVNVGGMIYTNDDREPRDLSSEVTFQVGADRDAEVLVEVTNRDQYGPDKSYRITVEEIIPSTPTPTSTPTSTPTPTVSSSSSRSPGAASQIPASALADPACSLPMTVKRASIFSLPPIGGGRNIRGIFSPDMVEFVIVLELKAGSP